MLSWFLALLLLTNVAYAAGIPQTRAFQGKTLVIHLPSEEAFSGASAVFLGQQVKFFPSSNGLRGLFAVPPEQKSGKYKMEITAIKGGSTQKTEKWIAIRPTRFASAWFRLKPAKKKLFTPDLIQKEWAQIEKVLLAEDPVQKWEGKFTLPVKGPVSMPFGTVEHINGKRTGQHRGLDLAVPSGTKVRAANSGKVVFAENLKAFGGTIIINHGQGVHSLYFHLSKFISNAGNEVAKGEAIALSGNSGISSGPHLHWGMSVNNVRVDPVQWTKISL